MNSLSAEIDIHRGVQTGANFTFAVVAVVLTVTFETVYHPTVYNGPEPMILCFTLPAAGSSSMYHHCWLILSHLDWHPRFMPGALVTFETVARIGEKEPCSQSVGMWIGSSSMGNYREFPKEIRNKTAIWPNHPSSEYALKEKEIRIS